MCEGQPKIPSDVDFKTACFAIRGYLEAASISVLNLKVHEAVDPKVATYPGKVEAKQPGEAIANIMLAYRHLEDARMRLGKAIQAFDGDKSYYPR